LLQLGWRGEPSLSPQLRDELNDFRAGIKTDFAGASKVTTIAAGYVRRLTEVEAVLHLLGTASE
jgi:hypothetical protein